MKRHEEMQGILYLVIGEGEDNWDSQPPVPRLATSRLTREIYRQILSLDQLVYLDSKNEQTEMPTSRLEITAEFRGEDLELNGSQPLREFGLFGGDATAEPDSGFMIDYVIHPRIDLTSGLRLIRKVRLSFGAGGIPEEDLGRFGADLPVINIDGVGEEYAAALGDQGINLLGDPAEIAD